MALAHRNDGSNAQDYSDAVKEAVKKPAMRQISPIEGVFERRSRGQRVYIEADEVWVRRRGNNKKGLGMEFVVAYEGKTGRKKCLRNRRSVGGVTDERII